MKAYPPPTSDAHSAKAVQRQHCAVPLAHSLRPHLAISLWYQQWDIERFWFYPVSTCPDPLKHAGYPGARLPEHSHGYTLATCLSAKATPPQHHGTIRTSQKHNFCIFSPKSPELGAVPAVRLSDLNGSWMWTPLTR